MMNHCVPDFEMDEDYAIPIPTSSSSGGGGGFAGLIRPPTNKKSAIGEEEIMELLWQNGQVVLQSQNQRSLKKSPPNGGAVAGEPEIPAHQREIRSLESESMSHHHHQLFMQEDEMASWLHYPLDDSTFDRDIYSDLLYPPPPPSAPITTTTPSSPSREIGTIVTEIRSLPPPPPAAMPPRPPIPPMFKCAEAAAAVPPRFQNFMHFSRLPKASTESGPSNSSKAANDLTVVDSNETPIVGPESRVSHAADSTPPVSGGNVVGCGTMSCTPAPVTSTAPRDLTTACELTVTSSPGGSGASSAEQTPNHKPSSSTAENRKRKGGETDETECHSEVINGEYSKLLVFFFTFLN
ncbi:hypothetical protein ACH5RR_010471 [Cinchona calisaya]|uniref:Uncharacterized protein n=1 Tax=Cinchona calisaya TaxID=153742 RepID=A0ABD3AJ23_9GENT